jgi:hypothetical protein
VPTDVLAPSIQLVFVTSAVLAAALLLIGCLMPRDVTEPETEAA